MTDTIVIGTEIYSGFNNRNDTNDDETVTTKLAFVTYKPLDGSKRQLTAFNKRKETVDRWHNQDSYDYVNKVRTSNNLKIEEFKNVVLTGYKISDHVRRYGWGSGNVLWRIADPRGFEFEISSANMASLIAGGTITNGIINEPCILGWCRGAVVLLPTNSQPYRDALITTDNRSHTVKLKDVCRGDMVTLSNGKSGQWLGRLHYLFGGYTEEKLLAKTHHPRKRYFPHRRMRLESTARTSCFIKMDDGSVYVIASPTVSRIDNKTTTELSGAEASAIVNDQIQNGYKLESATNSYPVNVIIHTSDTHIDPTQASIRVVESKEPLDVSKSNGRLFRYKNILCRWEHGVAEYIDEGLLNQNTYGELLSFRATNYSSQRAFDGVDYPRHMFELSRTLLESIDDAIGNPIHNVPEMGRREWEEKCLNYVKNTQLYTLEVDSYGVVYKADRMV